MVSKLVDGKLVELSTEEVSARSDKMSNPTTAKMILTNTAAKTRYSKEIGGITVDGMTIDTSRTSQAQIQGAYSIAQANSSATFQWKTGAGQFTTLTAAQIISMAQAVAAFVQSCYAQEASVVSQINSGTLTTIAQVKAAFTS